MNEYLSSSPAPKKTHLGIVRDLYPMTNVEGKPNKEVHRAAKILDEEFNAVGAYIGVAPEGSMSDDYANSGSDIDFKVIANRDKPDVGRFWLMSSENLIGKASARIKKETGRDAHIGLDQFSLMEFAEAMGHIKTYDLKYRGKLHSPTRLVDNSDNMQWIGLAIGTMSRLIKGERVNEIREEMKKSFDSLSTDLKSKILDIAAKRITKMDAKSRWKRAERKTGHKLPIIFDRRMVKEWKMQREKDWRKRLALLWN
jgi:hypothetical protein